jgi:hypothetical protein
VVTPIPPPARRECSAAQLRPELRVVFPFVLRWFTSTPAIAATPLIKSSLVNNSKALVAHLDQKSQDITLPIAKSQTRIKQNKDMHKFSSVYSERGVLTWIVLYKDK